MNIKTSVKSGRVNANLANHNQARKLRVRTGVKAGGLYTNHNQAASPLKIRTGVKAGNMKQNHNQLRA
jgi:hypothetical protein